MSDPVDLPDLVTLRRRWWTLAVAYRSVGIDDVWMSGAGRDAYAQDGVRLDLVAFDDARAVLMGYDPELGDAGASHPMLRFDGAPMWVPRAPILPGWPIGDVAWFDGGRWHRSSAARDVARAVEVAAVPLRSADDTADELAALAPEADESAALALASEGATAEGLTRLLGRDPRFDPRRAGFPPA